MLKSSDKKLMSEGFGLVESDLVMESRIKKIINSISNNFSALIFVTLLSGVAFSCTSQRSIVSSSKNDVKKCVMDNGAPCSSDFIDVASDISTNISRANYLYSKLIDLNFLDLKNNIDVLINSVSGKSYTEQKFVFDKITKILVDTGIIEFFDIYQKYKFDFDPDFINEVKVLNKRYSPIKKLYNRFYNFLILHDDFTK